jgi:hypothetical protein
VIWPPSERPEYIGYQEFACSETLARELMAGGMTHVNEEPVYLQHMDTLADGRWIIHVWPRVGRTPVVADPPLRITIDAVAA